MQLPAVFYTNVHFYNSLYTYTTLGGSYTYPTQCYKGESMARRENARASLYKVYNIFVYFALYVAKAEFALRRLLIPYPLLLLIHSVFYIFYLFFSFLFFFCLLPCFLYYYCVAHLVFLYFLFFFFSAMYAPQYNDVLCSIMHCMYILSSSVVCVHI